MKTKVKVIHLIQSLHSGGCENMLLRTVPHFSPEFAHEIVTLKERGELAPQFEAKGITVTQAPHKGTALARWIASQEPDLVITYLFHADVFGRLTLRRYVSVPVIPFLRTTYNFKRYWPARLFEKVTRSMALHYFANSVAVKNFYVSNIGVKPEKITVIPNGLDVSAYTDHAIPPLPFTLSKEMQLIACVANLAPNKGHTYLLAAFNRIAEFHPHAQLLLVGEGGEREKLEGQHAQSPYAERIFFLGRRNDVPAVLAHSDIFVLPTLFEGMSNALLEGMAAGCACITTDIPENRVVMTHNETGILVPPQDSTKLAEALDTLLKNNAMREKLGKTAQGYIREHYSLPTVVAQWEAAIRKYARKG